jgi:PAP2 superfamily
MKFRAIASLVTIPALFAAQPAAADTATDWIELTIRINNILKAPPGTPPRPDRPRATTRVGLAMFEALNAIDRRYESYLGLAQGDPKASQDAAAANAAYDVLLDHFPNLKHSLDDSLAITMAGIADGPAKDAGKALGQQAAKLALAAGGVDPSVAQTPYRPVTTPGVWVATDLPSIDPVDSAFKRWALSDIAALRIAPPALTSARWAKDYDEVKRLGGANSKDRTARQTLMAQYRIVPDISSALRAAAEAPGRSQVQNARLFARVYMAGDDASLAMADAKMHYNTWRPITAIRNGDLDGNDATARDPEWEPLLPTPNFPEYPCGHCIYAAAVASVMAAETGDRPTTGVRVSSLIAGNSIQQVLPSWSQWVQEVSDSRIYAGAHFRFANEAGELMGRAAGRAVLDRVMKPLPAKKGS